MSNSSDCEDNVVNDSSPSPVTKITRKLAFASFDSTPCVNKIASIFDDDQPTPLASKNTIFRQKKIGRRISKLKSSNMNDRQSTLSSSIFDECANMEAPPLADPYYFMTSDTISMSSESSGFGEEYQPNRYSLYAENSKSSCSMTSIDEGFVHSESVSSHTVVHEDCPTLARFYQSPELSASPVLSFNKNSNFHRTTSNDSDSSFLRRRSSVPVLANLVRQNSLTAEMATGYFQRRNQLGLDTYSDMSSCYENQSSENSSPVRGKVTSSELDDTATEEDHKVTPKRRRPCFISSGDTPLLPGGTLDSPQTKSTTSRPKVLGCINSPLVNSTYRKPMARLSSNSKLSDITNTLSRCHSISSTLDENKVASSIASRDTYFLAGDSKSRSVLPTMEATGQGRQFELSCVSTDTVADLIQGRYESCVSDYTIIDCRYPYEFTGGHICSALNIYTHDQLLNMFFRKSQHSNQSRRAGIRFSETERKSVLIFHCEFSSKRAPTLAKFLRSVDRSSNFHQYPNLFFPEIYVMKGGYSDFFKRCPELCTPDNYIKMFDPRYRFDLKCSEKICKESKSSCLMRIRNEQDELSPVPLPSLRSIEICAEFGSQSTTSSPSIRFLR